MNASVAELVDNGVRWAVADHTALLLVASVLPLLVLLTRLNTLGLIALGILAAVLGLVHADALTMPMAAFLLLGSCTLLLAIDGTLARRRIRRTEERLASLGSALRALEMSEERRQSLLSRGHSPVNLMADGDRVKTSAGNGTEEVGSGFRNGQQGFRSAEALRRPVADADGVLE